MTVAALFIDPEGHYPELLGPENCWDEKRDALTYSRTDPVVAHPPCQLWVNFAAVNWKRYKRQKPAWYFGGHDGGCFLKALMTVRNYGGVLEHPAGTHAWGAYGLERPIDEPVVRVLGVDVPGVRAGFVSGWRFCIGNPGRWEWDYWTCEVWQSAPRYGHRARKRTWLLYCGKRPPFELDWTRRAGTHQVGWFDRNKPTLSKREAMATPEAFARELIRLAEWSRG